LIKQILLTKKPYYVQVALPTPLYRVFSYCYPTGLPAPKAGQLVRVPFGKQKESIGIIVSSSEQCELDPTKVKDVLSLLHNEPLLGKNILALYEWASAYYAYPLGLAIQAGLPSRLRQGEAPQLSGLTYWQATEKASLYRLSRAPLQAKVLNYLLAKGPQTASAIKKMSGVQIGSVLKALVSKSLVSSMVHTPQKVTPKLAQTPLKLNTQQEQALSNLQKSLQGFSCTLLEGITGSGKTEIYLQLIWQVLQKKKQVLVLVPEINLTPQTLARFTARFNCRIVTLHSNISETDRKEAWLLARSGLADIIIGTRSAVFTPLARPGLCIIDEEHDSSFKQHEGFRYHGRDVAIYRANKEKYPVVLGSATPSLESLQNALQGKYQHLQLLERAGGATAPVLKVHNMHLHTHKEGFSETLLAQIKEHLHNGQQVLVYLNRRGFAPLLQCQECGWIAECPRCERSYTLHLQPKSLLCHHCITQKPIPHSCPACQRHTLSAIGAGTERIEVFLQEHFKQFPVIRIDRDSTRKLGSMEAKLNEIQTGTPCILVGTQMLAKGHHFPGVTMVAILEVDSCLFSTDFRAQENLGQLLMQVAGRAGRSNVAGEVVMQTYYAQHPALQQLLQKGYSGFARTLLKERQHVGMPPFSHLALLRAEAFDQKTPVALLKLITEKLTQLQTPKASSQISYYGPLASPLGRKAGVNRYQLLLHCHSRKLLQETLARLTLWMDQSSLAKKAARKVRWYIDVDAIDFS
jgi:primosomal protein N' (replication factor Y)